MRSDIIRESRFRVTGFNENLQGDAIVRLILLFLVTVLASCQQYIKVVDHNGKPLVGAVVLSEDRFYGWYWDVGASVVGNTGGVALANWISPHGVYIFHEDFHTARGGHALSWGSINNGLAKLYPKKRPGNVVVTEEVINIEEIHEGQPVPLIFSRCDGVNINYDSDEEILEITSRESILYPSDQFFFLGSKSNY